jgi:hypothetical protein
MRSFDDRKNAFEKAFTHNSEMQFRAEARRNMLLGRWAAELMGLSGDAVDAYAASVVAEDLKEAGDNDVYRKVAADLEAKGKGRPEAELREKMAELLLKAKDQIVREAKP